MGMEETIRRELLDLRKQRSSLSPEALAHTEALRTILGDGDPRVAYNSLKHIALSRGERRSIMAASYSLGFASDGTTHLDRLTEFGDDYGFDQRQARRYSDRGIAELASWITRERTIEASPVLRAEILRADDVALEVVLITERLIFIEMQAPLLEAVHKDGQRDQLDTVWDEATGTTVRSVTTIVVEQNDPRPALSVCWRGESFPLIFLDAPLTERASNRLLVQALGNRLQISISQ
jgi:hypothetical protein